MIVLILGVALWWGAHLFKRIAPARRAALTERFGNRSKGIVAAAIGLALVLMIVGYRSAAFVPVWTPPAWTIHVNNLLMLAAVALMGMGQSKGRARAWLRHPMLTGATTWSVAHLLVNGDLASLILFGGIGAWALVSMRVINAQDGPWQRPEPGPVSGDVRLAVITAVVFAVIAVIHTWLGYWPFPR